MFSSIWLKAAPYLLCVVLGYTTYHFIGKLATTNLLLKQATANLVLVNDAKVKSEAAQLELTNQVAQLQVKSAKVITRLIKVPVVVEEKCVSPVLKEALKLDDM